MSWVECRKEKGKSCNGVIGILNSGEDGRLIRLLNGRTEGFSPFIFRRYYSV